MPDAPVLQTDPDSTDLSELRRELLRECSRSAPGVRAPLMPRERARQKLAAGVPLLHGEQLDPDEPFCRELFHRLLEVPRQRRSRATAFAEEIAHAVAGGRLDLGRALEEALADHADHLAELAAWAQVDRETLADLLELAARPSLRAVAAAYRPLLDRLDGWERGYCPVCGAQAELPGGEVMGGLSRLRCPRCAAEWAAPSQAVDAPVRGFRLELGEHEPDEALEALLELD